MIHETQMSLKQLFLSFLKKINCYHPLQSGYRRLVFLFARSVSSVRHFHQRGTGIHCVFCGYRHLHFMASKPLPEDAQAMQQHDTIAGYGEDMICPFCLSNARERMVRLLVSHHYSLDGIRILHCSPEKKIYQWLIQRASVTTADLHPGFYRNIDKKIEKQDITRLTYDDDSFDMVMANHVLEHVPDDVSAMKELYRVLKPGGHAVLQVPIGLRLTATVEEPSINDPKRQSALFGQRDHVRIYALKDYVTRLILAGFEVSYYFPAEAAEWKHDGLQEREPFFLITKPLVSAT